MPTTLKKLRDHIVMPPTLQKWKGQHAFALSIHSFITFYLVYKISQKVFLQSMIIERIHLQFCKKLLGVKQCAQNDLVYSDWS